MAHMHYTGTGKVHSYRGLLTSSTENRIRIQGSVGAIAWRITKFQIMPGTPGVGNFEGVAKIYRESQAPFSAAVDFTEDELLAAAYYQDEAGDHYPSAIDVIFDNALFVRNIYVSFVFTTGSQKCNYYIELEEVKVSAAGMAQLAVAAARRNYVPGT